MARSTKRHLLPAQPMTSLEAKLISAFIIFLQLSFHTQTGG